MRTGRPDLDARLSVKDIPDGEPWFVIRGKDALAAEAVRAYAALAAGAGVDLALIEQALAQADAIEAWPTKALPNADHLTPAARKQLAYQLGRRAWAARHDETATPQALLLAERRGFAAGLAAAQLAQQTQET